jgi:hypothetical protein
MKVAVSVLSNEHAVLRYGIANGLSSLYRNEIVNASQLRTC